MGKFMTDEELEWHREQAKLFVPGYLHPFDNGACLSKPDYKRALDELQNNDKYDETLWKEFHATENEFNGSSADLNKLLINSISNAFNYSKKEFQIWDDAMTSALGWDTESLTMMYLKALDEETEDEDEDEDTYA